MGALRTHRGLSAMTPVRAVVSFALLSVAVQLLVGVGALRALEPRLVDEALDRESELASYVASSVIAPAVTPELLAGDPGAVAEFDRLVRERVLRPSVVRVKLWSADGTVLYSDDPRFVGRSYQLSSEQQRIIRAGAGVDAQRVDFDRLEHEFDVDLGSVNEVYVAIRAPGGQVLMWESHVFQQRLTDRARDGLALFAIGGVTSAGVVLIAQLASALALGRQLVEARQDRLRLLRSAADASTFERQRIASDLHDGVVQDLVGVALELSAHAGDRQAPAAPGAVDGPPLDEVAERVRSAIRQLRTLMVDIYPANLEDVGLPVALEDLLDRCEGRMEATLDVRTTERLDPETERVLYRAAQEGVRNALAHSGGRRVEVSLERQGSTAVLEVVDDGIGPVVTGPDRSGNQLGLALLSAIVEASGGALAITGAPGGGARLRVEVPA